MISNEASRVLRLTSSAQEPAGSKPPLEDATAWRTMLEKDGDAESGGRLFFTAAGVHCSRCHQHHGRGAKVGPDLTNLGSQSSVDTIITSILHPSAEIAPRYEPWVLTMDDGSIRTGFRLPQGGDNGIESYVDDNGEPFMVSADEIESRQVSQRSIMPDGIENILSIQDLRDLVAFLTAK